MNAEEEKFIAEIGSACEMVLTRRIYQKRMEGYTLEAGLEIARAALTAIRDAGYWLAPIEPTKEMLAPAQDMLSHFEGEYGDYNVYFREEQFDEIYCVMRDASPLTIESETDDE